MSRRMRIKGVLNFSQKPKVENKSNEKPEAPEDIVESFKSGVSSEKSECQTFSNAINSVVSNSGEKDVSASPRALDKPDSTFNCLSPKASPIPSDARKSPTPSKIQGASETTNEKEAFVKPRLVSEASSKFSVVVHREQPPGEKDGSDTETTTLDTNPTKHLNRPRIKAVPILARQHNSISESEDDPKAKRARTESSSQPNPSATQEHSTIVQRKCRRSEQSRKMAEAKRSFASKFGDKNPDKQKLTMIDLIFYNPASNPMTQKQKKPNTITEKEYSEINDEANEDDPDPIVESDEENRIPAPQVTLGPNGEIIVDEKSLVIEDREVKRKRAELERAKAIDADLEGSSGFYKRSKRCKDWTNEETILFYKCLRTLGTDFTLMTQLFKERTRKELKMKFKKEERLNSYLINMAISRPAQFDITGLKAEVETSERNAKMQEEKMLQLKDSKSEKQIPYMTKRGRNTSSKNRTYKIKHKPPKKKRRDTYSSLERGLKVSSSESEDEGKKYENTSSLLKPTRSGRIPKPSSKSLDNTTDVTLDEEEVQDEEEEQTEEVPNNLQPGSIVIITAPSETGEPTMQVFMTTPTGVQVPVAGVTPEMIQDLMNQHATMLNTQKEPSNEETPIPQVLKS